MKGEWLQFLQNMKASGISSALDALQLFTYNFERPAPSVVVAWCLSHFDK